MLLNYLLLQPHTWIIPMILQGLSYAGVFRKMGLPWPIAFVPGYADYVLSKKFFSNTRAFWRPFLTTSLLVACAIYLNPFGGTGKTTALIFLHLAILIYELFLFRLYRRLGVAFGKKFMGIPFALITAILPPLGLGMLALGKATYQGDPVFKDRAPRSRFLRFVGQLIQVAFSLAEAAAVIAVVGFFTIRAYPPRIIANSILHDTLQDTAEVTGTGEVVTREDAMGSAASKIATLPTSRDKFFPDHSQDKSVVVMGYMIGSDLEDRLGLASANMSQAIDATKQGSGLTFVFETGGSQRWFTKGIKDGSYGRYVARDGKLEKAQDLPKTTCMSEPQQLADFIIWAKENYPADRYILVLWDHGSGFGMGYGYDALNKREGDNIEITVSEICDAIAQSGVTFDIIGFDACLMQDIEVAASLEPYADYLLASEEVEGGFGWCWTSGFGMLAQNPGLPSEDFGREMIACYDPYNTIINSGEPDTTSTLSFVDLPLAKAAYDKMGGFFTSAREAMRADSASFANLSLAGTKSYGFQSMEHVDLIDFLENLGKMDYEDLICTDEERDELIDALRACVLYRNGNSAKGVNGIAFAFPVQSMESYGREYREFNELSFSKQEDLYSDFFSIIAAQRKKEVDSIDSENASTIEMLTVFAYQDMTKEDWYVEGFEDYESQPALIDIPLVEVEDGYRIEMPDKVWDIIADTQLIAYQKADGELLRYLGRDYIGTVDEDGNPLVAMEGTWVHVGSRLCSYEAGETRETDEGVIFTGVTKAMLNDTQPIRLYIEWDPVNEGEERQLTGHIIGYDDEEFSEAMEMLESLINADSTEAEVFNSIISKGKQQLEPGDKIEFLFDYYDGEGQLVKTEPYGGALRVSNQQRIVVSDKQMASCDVVFGGVMTDVYQRTMTTEKIEAHVS